MAPFKATQVFTRLSCSLVMERETGFTSLEGDQTYPLWLRIWRQYLSSGLTREGKQKPGYVNDWFCLRKEWALLRQKHLFRKAGLRWKVAWVHTYSQQWRVWPILSELFRQPKTPLRVPPMYQWIPHHWMSYVNKNFTQGYFPAQGEMWWRSSSQNDPRAQNWTFISLLFGSYFGCLFASVFAVLGIEPTAICLVGKQILYPRLHPPTLDNI